MRVVKKPEERKAEMVAAAAKLFAEQGSVSRNNLRGRDCFGCRRGKGAFLLLFHDQGRHGQSGR